MSVIRFPSVELADEHGLLAMGGDLEVDSLLLAYRSGIFPWPLDEETLTWFAPPMRAVLFLDKLHTSHSLAKERRREKYDFAIDRSFGAVIEACSELKNRGEQHGTWITEDIKAAYINFHKAGYCHSFESYENEKLVGGMYGVTINGFFAGESMFYRSPNASKLAFLVACERLKECGYTWIDCQVMTPFLKSFGAEEIPRKEFMKMLKAALLKTPRKLTDAPKG